MFIASRAQFDVVLSVQPDGQWLSLIDHTVRVYLEARGFPQKLMDQCLAAIGEAAEQMLGLQITKGLRLPFDIGLIWHDESVGIHLIYAANIPLNPHREPEYEVPDVDSVLSEVSADGLWLHLIKRTMDRVFFRLDGSRASLVMVKYHREERHAREAWVLGRRPKLRADLVLEVPPDERNSAVPSSAILHDTRGRSVLQLSRSEAFVAARMDGVRTLREIYLEHAVELGPLPPQQVRMLYERFEAARLLDVPNRKAGWGERWNRWLAPVFSLPQPDRTVTWLYRRTRLLFRPLGVAVFFLIGLSGFFPLYQHAAAFREMVPRFDRVFSQQPLLLAGVYGLALLFVALHELAHGLTCKHFGGSVKQLGVMWYLAMFIFFCDTTSAWTFPKKYQRIWVSLAGPLMSWLLLGISAWCAAATIQAGSSWAVVWVTLVLMGSFSLAMNFNPLIRMDAYYMLVDWTGIPNLQRRAFAYLRTILWGLFRTPDKRSQELPTVRERRIFVVYGLLSGAMSLVFIVLPFLRLAAIWRSQRQFTAWGMFGLFVVVLLIGRIIFKAAALTYATRYREYKLS